MAQIHAPSSAAIPTNPNSRIISNRFDQQRANHILGGVDRVVDHAGERVKDEFLSFLERFSLDSNGNHISFNVNTIIPTSELLSMGLGSDTLSPPTIINNHGMGFNGGIDGGANNDNMAYFNPQKNSKYRQQVLDMKSEGRTTLYVEWNDLYRFNDVLATAIVGNYYRYEPYLRAAVQKFVAEVLPSYSRNLSSMTLSSSSSSQSRHAKDFWISISGLGIVHKLRELTCQKVGQLLAISGTVTRTSEVRPELFTGTFQCRACMTINRGISQQFKYTEPPRCINYACSNASSWSLISEESVFVNWQRIRLQENSSEIPPGSMPRSIDVIVRNDAVERAKAGDKCEFIGSLIVVPEVGQLINLPNAKMEGGASAEGGFNRRNNQGTGNGPTDGITGLKKLGVRDLTYKLAFLAINVQPVHIPSHLKSSWNSAFDEVMMDDPFLLEEEERTREGIEGDNQRSKEKVEGAASHQHNVSKMFTPLELSEIHQMKNTPGILLKLIDSIAPNIYGHSEIKTGLLLMLIGGIHKRTSEGIRLRGDINICIVGDPGTAKSQFLRHIVNIMPRSVYTSGKSSSAAGLTASVLKDEETGDFTIEAGALMLADNGICAIDEFDKMDIRDQVAIHEAMEQQTISIAKAGIQATLNARTSILAAANPIGGRYDKSKTLRQNISMTAPILSRFDLFFVILDHCDESSDYNIARHILSLHSYREEAVTPPFSIEQVQRYLRWARTIKPIIGEEAAECLVERYKTMRQADSTPGNGTGSFRMTVRQLESMIRLAEALARLHGDFVVRAEHVRDASRLIKSSLIRVETENINLAMESVNINNQKMKLDTDNQENHDGTRDNFNTENGNEIDNSNINVGATATIAPLVISYEEYVRISNMLIFHLRNSERLYEDASIANIESQRDENDENRIETETETENDSIDSSSFVMKKNSLIEWYLEQIEEQIDTEAAYHINKKIVESIINRLVKKDMVLIELKNNDKEVDPFLVVHPNYVPN